MKKPGLSIKYFLFGVNYIANYQLFRKKTPLVCGMTVTNACNLRCRHCRVMERGARSLTFEEIISAMQSFYQQGGRTLYLQGGEPFIWRDGKRTIEDIIVYSHNMGFLTSIIYTNGTIPINTSASTVFVSMDGIDRKSVV